MRHVVYIYGGPDSGRLGRALCEELGYEFMNIDDDDRISRALSKAENAVIAGLFMTGEEKIIPYVTLAVCLKRDTGAARMSSKEKQDLWKEAFPCPQILLNGAGDQEENCRIVKQELELCAATETIKGRIRCLFEGEHSGHDFWHSMRVYQNAMRIAWGETCDREVVALAALLHDVDDTKLFETRDYANARKMMKECGIDGDRAENVITVIKGVSFGKNGTNPPETLEGKIVQDADRLDAIGALGIARAFAFGGSRGRAMYEPDSMIDEGDMVPPGVPNTTIFHFYEKLFLLKDGMNTGTARTIAVQRDTVMQVFLEEFFAEWNGKR